MIRSLVLLAWIAASVSAAPIVVTGDYVRATFTDLGVLSHLWYDSTGTRNFGVNDYIAPGAPWEGFAVRSGLGAAQVNNNNGSVQQIGGSITSSSGGTTGGSVTWDGGTTDFTIQHVFSFSNSDRRVNISTTFTALTALTTVRLSRFVDPDPDVNAFGTFQTVNQRGNTTLGLSVHDFVGSAGAVSGRPLGLLYTGTLAHDTGITSSFTFDPDIYLSGGTGGNSNTSDSTIGLGFLLGDFAAGSSVTFDYAYVMGDSVNSIDTGVPEPGTTALVAAGLLALAFFRRRS